MIRAYVLVYRDVYDRGADVYYEREIVDAYSAEDAKTRGSMRMAYIATQCPLVDVEPFDRRRTEHRTAAHRDWPQPHGGAPPHLLSEP